MLRILEKTFRTQLPKDRDFLDFWKIELEKLGAKQILQWAVETYHPSLVLATSFGVSGYVILSILAELGHEIETINLGFDERTIHQYDAILLDQEHAPILSGRQPILQWDENFGPVKIAPLARWSEAMLRNRLFRDSF